MAACAVSAGVAIGRRCASTAVPAASRGLVLGLGSSVVDMFFRIRAVPPAGGKGYFRDPSRHTEGTSVGGVTLNHLSWTSLLGVPTGLLALQGEDQLGQQIRAKMLQLGISTDHLLVGPQYATAVSHVYVDDHGERAIMMATGSNGQLSAEVFDAYFAAAARRASLLTAEICQVPLSSVLRMLAVARAEGIPSCVDVDVPPAVAVSEAGLGTLQEVLATARGCVVLKPTLEAAPELLALWKTGGECSDPAAAGVTLAKTPDQVAGQLLEALQGPQLVAVTDGSRGCGLAFRSEGKDTAQPARISSATVLACPGVHQIDSTGAGDAFFGGLVAAVYHLGLPATTEELICIGETARALGAACCEVLGALPQETSAARVHDLLPHKLKHLVHGGCTATASSSTSISALDPRDNIGVGPGAGKLTLAEWSKKKNSGAGPAVSDRCRALRLGTRPAVQVERVPGVPDFMPAVLLRGVLSKEECQDLIEAVPNGGRGYFCSEEILKLYNDRVVKYRYLTHDEGLSKLFSERLLEHIPKELDGGSYYRVNPAWRFIHYEGGGHQAAHVDGREPVEPASEADGWVQSRLTLQVYLSEDFEGGGLAFVLKDPSTRKTSVRHVLQPKAGDAVLFYQERLLPPTKKPPYELLHEALDVTAGNKYACRTMIDYIFADQQQAKMSNLKDDWPSS